MARGRNDDTEDEHDGAEPDDDGEPSLGAEEGRIDQRVWAVGNDADLEPDDAA
jgi:hypothetical protein